MELLPLGPVVFIDTAGIDDEGALGELRIRKTQKTLERVDLGIIITDGTWDTFEQTLLDELQTRDVPIITVFNKIDINKPSAEVVQKLKDQKLVVIHTAVSNNIGISDFRQALLNLAPEDFIDSPAIVGDIVGPGQTAVLVVPIDKEAPRGRLILPQVQSIRDLLDTDAMCLVVKERELRAAMNNLKHPPKLVVTDSQAFLKVAADTPPEVPMTSFSILYSRFKGNLISQTLGAMAAEKLKPSDTVLIAESCSHHPIGEDIGRIKIPRWLTHYVGGKLNFTTVQGQDFPDDLSPYKLVIHCGACMWNRRTMLNRILKCRSAGVPITNYGLVIAYSLGIFERALKPFPAALDAYTNNAK